MPTARSLFVALAALASASCTHVETVERGGNAIAWSAAPTVAPVHSDRRALHDALAGAIALPPEKLKACAGKTVSLGVVADESFHDRTLAVAEQALYRTVRTAGCVVAPGAPNRVVLTIAALGWDIDALQTETTTTTYLILPIFRDTTHRGVAQVRARASVIVDVAVDGSFTSIPSESSTFWRVIDGPGSEYWPRADLHNLDTPTPRKKVGTVPAPVPEPEPAAPLLSLPSPGDF